MFYCVSLGLLLLAGSALSKSLRIVGGEPTTVETYPFIVQIDSFTYGTGIWSQSCGGNILNNQWILSAAQCFEGWIYSPEYRRVRAGSSYRNSGGTIHYVHFERNHYDYARDSRYDADITVVRLHTPLVYSPTVQKGTIITHDSVLPDGYAVIQAGWGKTVAGGSPSNQLQHVQMYTINHDLCVQRYREANLGRVTVNMICTGILDVGGRDGCDGDSGGPLLGQGVEGHVIVGIRSWGHGCGNETYPGISTKVASYTEWVISSAQY